MFSSLCTGQTVGEVFAKKRANLCETRSIFFQTADRENSHAAGWAAGSVAVGWVAVSAGVQSAAAFGAGR
jgi:hypothetical protein